MLKFIHKKLLQMRMAILLLFSFYSSIIVAQTFTEISNIHFDGVRQSAMAFADVDNDADYDVLITGRLNTGQVVLKTILYLNNGSGYFERRTDTPFEGVIFGAIAFADIDNDFDQDVLITGKNTLGFPIAKLYMNNGNGQYNLVEETPFEGVQSSAIVFVDVDGDNDQDVFISGMNADNIGCTNLYLNDGFGNFTKLEDTPFVGVVDSAIAVADVDNDNDEDILITGTSVPTVAPGPISYLYLNDGNGNFSWKSDTPFQGVAAGALAFADVDGDNDQDVLITGMNIYTSQDNIISSKLYLNNGSGDFSEIQDSPFEGVYLSALAFADVDGDKDQDVLITGQNIELEQLPYGKSTKLYLNEGTGQFIEQSDTPFEAVARGSIAFFDVDNDLDQDVILTGWNTNSDPTSITKLYINESLVFTTQVVNEVDFHLYPNPIVTNEINLIFQTEQFENLEWRILDINGRILNQNIEKAYTGENTIPIDLSSLPKGTYFIHLKKGDQLGIQQFVIQ